MQTDTDPFPPHLRLTLRTQRTLTDEKKRMAKEMQAHAVTY